jgi:hypothetical protein
MILIVPVGCCWWLRCGRRRDFSGGGAAPLHRACALTRAHRCSVALHDEVRAPNTASESWMSALHGRMLISLVCACSRVLPPGKRAQRARRRCSIAALSSRWQGKQPPAPCVPRALSHAYVSVSHARCCLCARVYGCVWLAPPSGSRSARDANNRTRRTRMTDIICARRATTIVDTRPLLLHPLLFLPPPLQLSPCSAVPRAASTS